MAYMRIQGLSGRVLTQSQHLAVVDAGQPPGPIDQQEAQGPHTLQDIGTGALARSGLRSRQRVELEAPQQVMPQDTELLPGAIGPHSDS